MNLNKFVRFQKTGNKIAEIIFDHDGFREEALKSVGLWGHPKADYCYAKAWEQAHAYGAKEVFTHLDMMADMYVDTPRA